MSGASKPKVRTGTLPLACTPLPARATHASVTTSKVTLRRCASSTWPSASGTPPPSASICSAGSPCRTSTCRMASARRRAIRWLTASEPSGLVWPRMRSRHGRSSRAAVSRSAARSAATSSSAWSCSGVRRSLPCGKRSRRASMAAIRVRKRRWFSLSSAASS